MANNQVPMAVFIVALLGAHEVKGFSTWCSRSTITSFQIGIFLNGMNYYCYAIKSAREESVVGDEEVWENKVDAEITAGNEKLQNTNATNVSSLNKTINSIENSARASNVVTTDINGNKVENVAKRSLIDPKFKSVITNSDSKATKRTVKNSKLLRR
uniref:Uncharacterized protein n=1 Tax=Glossina palpalis gambiensis TaxID=67801 RepID=A0A1B0B0J4_9MUSC